MADPTGFRQISKQLKAMEGMAAGKVIRSAALQSTTPVVRAARQMAPQGNPPFESGKDPYPVRSYKGNLRTPGFLKRNIARKSVPRENGVSVFVGVKPEAFYGVQFIELGTSTIPRNPWLTTAFEISIPAVDARFRQRLRALIDKAARRR